MKIVPAQGETIINRLRNSPGLFMVNLIIIIPIIIMGYLFNSELDEHKNSLKSEQLGLHYIAKIRPLIQHIPQHRGLSGGFLGGAVSFHQQMLTKQTAIDEMFVRLTEADEEVGTQLKTGRRVRALTNEWSTLKSKVLTHTPQMSYLAHTQLVSNIIELMTHAADTSELIIDPKLDSHHLMDLIVKQMPILTEGMGQSRVIGATAAASRMFASQEREELVIRLDRIRIAEKSLSNNLTIVFHENPGLKKVLATPGKLASASVASFYHLIQNELLDTHSITISPADIYGSSTKAIDAVFNTYDAIIPELDQLFSDRIQEAGRTQMITLVLIVGALLLVLIVSIAFYKALNRFKTTLDMTKDCVFMLNPDSLKFFYVNQAAIEQFGYSDAELMSLTPIELSMDDDESRIQERFAPLLDGLQESITFETHLRHKDGHPIAVEISLQYIEPHGEPARFVSIVRNVTERVEAEARLHETEERNSLLLESVGEGIYGLDAYGKTTFVNPAACIMLGYTAEELIGQDMHSLVHHSYPDGSTYPLEKCPVYDALSNGTIHKIDNEVLWCEDGNSFPIEYTCTPISKDGEHVGAVVNFRNIRERREAERAIVSARDEAERANQAKSEFLSSMSHELRTPMNAILGFAQILEYDGELSEENTDNVQEILKAGHHLLELINEVLDLARIESGRIDLSLEPVEVCPVVHECLNLVGTLIDKRDIHINHSGLEGAVVRADRTRFKQVLLNLLSNAVKYNREKGSVKLDMQSVGEDRLRIRVTDTGPGIPAEHLAELFQPFNRLDAENSEIEGTGIGLTITRRIVELMGGTVDVESEIGVGSTFWIELPLESQPKSEHGHEWVTIDSETLTQSSDAAEHTVLYIEDNPANLKLVAQLVGRRKHIHLLTAHTPELGIELALSHRPELILLDINMPGMDGYQVLEVFKAEANLKSIPVVAITANAMPRDIERGMAAGFTDYLTKPLDVTRFLAALDSNLGIDE